MTARCRPRTVLSLFRIRDRFWLSAGTSYAFNKDASVDVGVSYMHGQKVTIKEGPYTFESVGKAWLYGANFNYRF
jgi:long-chain fatty acid transport protein